ncbi:MAG: hypothetical protein FWH11_11510 [Micrococcales bacterium]|nr:hypothetical protein [Micrococcales bacterium]
MVGGLLLTVAATALGVALVPLVLDDGKKPTGGLGPAPTYTGTDFIPESRAQNVADAMSAFTTYVRVSDEVAQDGFHGWEDKLIPLTSSKVWAWHEDYSPRAEVEGYYQVGGRVVESVRLKENGYIEDKSRGMDSVYLGACIDSSGLQVVAPGSQDDGVPPGRYSVLVRVAHWPEKDAWGQPVPGKPGKWTVDLYSVDDPGGDPADGVQAPWSQDRASSCTEREGAR